MIGYEQYISYWQREQFFQETNVFECSQRTFILFILLIDVPFHPYPLHPLDQPEGFGLISPAVGHILPFQQNDNVLRPLNDPFHAEQGLHFHLLDVHEDKICDQVLGKHLIHEVYKYLLPHYALLTVYLRHIRHKYLSPSRVLFKNKHICFTLSIGCAYSIKLSDPFQVIQINILFGNFVGNAVRLKDNQFSFIADQVSDDYGLQTSLRSNVQNCRVWLEKIGDKMDVFWLPCACVFYCLRH